ncbi:MAG: hypothetical protein EA408_11045 [Marinilabiliales bacterium]|nr:MAG: hypothetical protein EA408_11045 [Marinilabiliales bacterium]
MILIATLIAAIACKKEECSVHPDAFRFSLVGAESGADLIGTGVYNTSEIGVYYLLNGQRNDLIVNIEPEPDGDLVEMVSAQLPMISLTGRSDTFYLVLNELETDTLNVVVELERRDGCNYHPYTLVIHNGKSLPIVEGKAFILEK